MIFQSWLLRFDARDFHEKMKRIYVRWRPWPHGCCGPYYGQWCFLKFSLCFFGSSNTSNSKVGYLELISLFFSCTITCSSALFAPNCYCFASSFTFSRQFFVALVLLLEIASQWFFTSVWLISIRNCFLISTSKPRNCSHDSSFPKAI